MDLIAEDLLLLLLDDDSGRPLVDSTRLTHALAGSLLLELALAGSVLPEGPVEKTAKGAGRIVAAGPQPTDPLLALAWEACADKPRRAAAVVQKIDSEVKEPLLERIAAKGWIQIERRKVLGSFRAARSRRPTDGTRRNYGRPWTRCSPVPTGRIPAPRRWSRCSPPRGPCPGSTPISTGTAVRP